MLKDFVSVFVLSPFQNFSSLQSFPDYNFHLQKKVAVSSLLLLHFLDANQSSDEKQIFQVFRINASFRPI